MLSEKINNNFRKEEISKGYYKFKAELQGNKFETEMTVEEVEESAKLTIDILEELKNINNSGVDRGTFEKIEKETENKEKNNEVLQVLSIWKRISTDRLASIMRELDRVRRVGGAWAMLIANPCLISAILSVYNRIVDSFDDDDLYLLSAFFLMRAVMNMHSSECSEE